MKINTVQDNERIVYSPTQMREHRNECKEKMIAYNATHNDKSYQLSRALLNIMSDDADYIPKVAGAGEIFTEGDLQYQLMHNGIKIILGSYYDVQWLTDVIYGLKGHHEPQEEKCFYEILKYIPENAVMIELGAYWGYYSLWFASEIKGAQNYLIEPDPHRLEIGEKNFALNNKTAKFFRAFAGKMKDNEPDVVGAQWISIDDFIDRERIDHVHILHADIQGAEVEMLETTINSLDRIDYFFISTHNHQTDHPPCRDFFKRHGFIILTEYMDWQSGGCDGLIVAKRPYVTGPNKIEVRTY